MKISDLEVRPEVARFALAMEAKLRENDGKKKHWRICTLNFLSQRLTQERRELDAAIETRVDVIGECADVANFAMMIADKIDQLPALPAARCGLESEASD